MTPAVRLAICAAIAAAPALWMPAGAQTMPGTHPGWFTSGHVYLGLSLGRSHYGVDCGGTAFVCDKTDEAVKLSAGAMTGNFWGVELGFVDLGRIARAGGTTRAQGLNLSLVGKAPLWRAFNVFGKVGTTYGRTDVSTAPLSTVPGGSDHGLGLSYGAGLSYDFTPRLSATLEIDSNDFRFIGGRDQVRSTNLGLQYRY